MESAERISTTEAKESRKPRISPWYDPTKRLIDVMISGALLLVAMPFLIVVAVLIALDSPGSVLYRREVVGRNGRPFYALKLRTMMQDGDAQVMKDRKLAKQLEAQHKLRDDPRVTRVGAVLRKTSIDEIPQLINVLRGEMSLVGPRMISFPELEKFGEHQDKILAVKPGITGLWQVSGRSDLDYNERVRLNVFYVDHRSIPMDLKILAKTIPAVLTGRGAY